MAKAELADLKKVEEARKRRIFGQILSRAVELAGLLDKDVCERLDVDRGQLSRWFNGLENPMVWKFHADELLAPALIAAQAEVTEGARIRTVIELVRKVG